MFEFLRFWTWVHWASHHSLVNRLKFTCWKYFFEEEGGLPNASVKAMATTRSLKSSSNSFSISVVTPPPALWATIAIFFIDFWCNTKLLQTNFPCSEGLPWNVFINNFTDYSFYVKNWFCATNQWLLRRFINSEIFRGKIWPKSNKFNN